MKNHYLIASFLALICSTDMHAQDLAGVKLLNCNFAEEGRNYSDISPINNFIQAGHTNNLNSNLSSGYSKISSNGTAYGYGLGFNENTYFVRSSPYSVGGNIFFSIQKYKKIYKRFYYNPSVNFSIGYFYQEQYVSFTNEYTKANNYILNIAFTPFGFAYKLNDRYLINASLGAILLNYTSSHIKYPNKATNDESGINYKLSLHQAFAIGFSRIIK